MNHLHSAFKKILPILLWILHVSLNAQQLPYKTIGLKDGLPQSTVFRMAQDRQGYMWFATQGGLCKYDGTQFDVYSQYDGIGSQFIRDIQFDERGQLWLATIDQGICCFDGQTFTRFNESTGLRSSQIRHFLKTTSGDYFISSIDTGIIWVDPYMNQKVIYTPGGEKVLFARDAIELPNGNVWVGFNNGIIELEKNKNYSPNYIIQDRFEIISFFQDSKGNIWAGGTQSLWQFTKNGRVNWSHYIPPYSEVWDILEDISTGTMYFATTTGLLQLNGKSSTWITSENGLTVSDTRSLIKDRNGHLWVGMQGGGAIILENKGIDNFGASTDVLGFATNTLAQDKDGNIWIATNNQGLVICDGSTTKKPAFITRSDIQNPFVSTTDSVTGDIFFAEYEGKIIRIRDEKIIWRWTPKTSEPVRILGIQYWHDKLLICTQAGFYTLSENDDQLVQLKEFGSAYFGNSFADEDGFLWVLKDGGNILRWKDGHIEDMSDRVNPSGGTVVQGLYDPKRKIHWFCSYSGLIAWNGKNTYKLHSKNGIHSDAPWSIALDHSGNIWLGLANGVECLDPEKQSSQFIGYDQGFTPIETNSCSILCDRDGNIWFGTVTTATRIRVDDIRPKKSIVQLNIPTISVNEEIVFKQDILQDRIDKLVLSYNKNNLVIDLNGICFDNAKDVKYSWCLSDHDERWTHWSSQREAIYSNLSPGVYTFKAKAVDPNGYEANEVEVKFIIKKPIWNRWWFYVAEVAVMIFIIFLSFRFTSNPTQNKLGNLLTLVSILIIFEALLIYVSDYVNKFTGGVPIFQLIMNVILAGTLHPLEQAIRKFMRKWAIKKNRRKLIDKQDTPSD